MTFGILVGGGCQVTAGAGDPPPRSAADGYGARTAAPLLAVRPAWSLPVEVLDDVASLGDAELSSARVTVRWSAGLERRLGSEGAARSAQALADALGIAWRAENDPGGGALPSDETSSSEKAAPEESTTWALRISEVPAAAVAVRQEGSCEGLLRQLALHEAVELSALEPEIDRLEDLGRASFRAALLRGEAVSGIDEALAARLSGGDLAEDAGSAAAEATEAAEAAGSAAAEAAEAAGSAAAEAAEVDGSAAAEVAGWVSGGDECGAALLALGSRLRACAADVSTCADAPRLAFEDGLSVVHVNPWLAGGSACADVLGDAGVSLKRAHDEASRTLADVLADSDELGRLDALARSRRLRDAVFDVCGPRRRMPLPGTLASLDGLLGDYAELYDLAARGHPDVDAADDEVRLAGWGRLRRRAAVSSTSITARLEQVVAQFRRAGERAGRCANGDDPPLRVTLLRGATTLRTVTVYPEQLWCDRGGADLAEDTEL